MRLSTGRTGPPRAGPGSCHGVGLIVGARRSSCVVATAATRQRRSAGGVGDDSGGAAAVNASDAAVDAADKPQRTRRRRATQAQSHEGAALPQSGGGAAAISPTPDGKDLLSLFADALAPAGSAAPQQKQVMKRVRKRKADIAAAPRSDPWATYTGLFEVVALQQARKQEARQQKKQAQGQQQQQQVKKQQQHHHHHQQQQEQVKQHEAKVERQSALSPPGPMQQQPKQQGQHRQSISGARRVGGLFVQRLPTGVPLVPTTRLPAAEPASSARSAAQQLAMGLLGGTSHQPAPTNAQQRVYIPQAASPPSLVNGEEPASSRWDARSEALRRMRMRTIRQYGETLAGALAWPVDGRQLLFAAPTHLPVAVQRTWTLPPGEVAVGPELASLLPSLNQEVKRALGVVLPERAVRGERGVVLSTATPRDVAANLQQWISVCGMDYVRQLLEVEPCMLVLPPTALLETLEALNRHMGVQPSDAVEFVLQHPALIGLQPDELEEQLEALGAAVGLTPSETRELALERPELLLYTEVELTLRMQALQRLLPGASGKLPAMVARRPVLLLRSPRALARDIRQLAGTLGLTDWAAARLVAGGPAILELSLATVARRLDRLRNLCSSHPKWQQQLTAMSPGGLGRCLRCSDTTFDRLALLLEAGLAGSSRLPKVKRILTLPTGWFDEAFKSLKEGRAAALSSKAVSEAAAGEDSDDEDDSGLLWAPDQPSGDRSGSGGSGPVPIASSGDASVGGVSSAGSPSGLNGAIRNGSDAPAVALAAAV